MGTVSSTGSGTASRRRRGRSYPGLPSSVSGGSGERQDTGDRIKVKRDNGGRWSKNLCKYCLNDLYIIPC